MPVAAQPATTKIPEKSEDQTIGFFAAGKPTVTEEAVCQPNGRKRSMEEGFGATTTERSAKKPHVEENDGDEDVVDMVDDESQSTTNSISSHNLSDADQGALDKFRQAFLRPNSTSEYKKHLIFDFAASHPHLLAKITAKKEKPITCQVTLKQNG